MKPFLIVVSAAFGLLVVAHIARAIVEPSAIHNPWVIGTTILSAGLCVWAVVLLRRLPK